MDGRMPSSLEDRMPEFLSRAPEVINKVFDILDLIVVRLVLLGLAAFGAYALLLSHRV
jgi:hypothetical protein